MPNKKLTKLEIGLIAVLIIMVIAIVAVVTAYYKSQNQSYPVLSTDGSNTTSTSDVVATAISDDEKAQLLDSLGEAFDFMHTQNLFLNVQSGESQNDVIFYNTDGEAISQDMTTNYITIYRDDFMVISMQDYIYYGPNSDALKTLEYAYKMALNGDAEVLGVNEEPQEGYTEIYIDIQGMAAIKQLYQMMNDDLASNMEIQLTESLENIGVEDVSQTNFRFYYAINEETQAIDGGSCYVYFGEDNAETATWDDVALNWYFLGIQGTDYWELDDRWYTMDWDNLENWTDFDEVDEVLDGQLDTIDAIMDKFMADHPELADVEVESEQ